MIVELIELFMSVGSQRKRLVNCVFSVFSCKEPVEPLTLDELAERCHAPEDVHTDILWTFTSIFNNYLKS